MDDKLWVWLVDMVEENLRVKEDKLYFITTVMHSSHLNTIDINGNEQQLTSLDGSVG